MKFKTSSQSHSFIEDVHRRVGARNKAVLGRAGLFLALNEGVPSDFKPADAQGVDLDDETIVGDELRDVVRAALNYRAKKALDEAGYRQSFRQHFEYGCFRLQKIWEESEKDQAKFVSTLVKYSIPDFVRQKKSGVTPIETVKSEVKLKLLSDFQEWSLNGPGTRNGLLVVSGKMGSGKSQLAFDLLAQLAKQGVRFVFFDLKGEFEDDPSNPRQTETRETFFGITGAQYVRLIEESLPINPLIKEKTSQANAQIASEIASLITAFAPQMGAKQENTLRNVYQDLTNPDFETFADALRDNGEEGVPLAIIQKLAQLNIFASRTDAISFDEWLSQSIIIDFKGLGNDNVTKSLAVAFILNCLMKQLNKNLPPNNGIQPIRMVLFIDEAHLLLPKEGKSGLLGALARQGRAWGFPVWLASQDADAFITTGANATNFAELAECGIHFSPDTLSEGEQRKIIGGVVSRDLVKGEAALNLQGKMHIGNVRQFYRDKGQSSPS